MLSFLNLIAILKYRDSQIRNATATNPRLAIIQYPKLTILYTVEAITREISITSHTKKVGRLSSITEISLTSVLKIFDCGFLEKY